MTPIIESMAQYEHSVNRNESTIISIAKRLARLAGDTAESAVSVPRPNCAKPAEMPSAVPDDVAPGVSQW